MNHRRVPLAFYAMRLAWRHLSYEKTKALMALMGVMFAALLVFMQLGFRDSLFQSAANLPLHLKGDLFIVHPQTNILFQGMAFPKSQLFRIYGHPKVASVTSVLMGGGQWRNPETKDLNTILVVGIEPQHKILQGVDPSMATSLLHTRGTVLFDQLSENLFGPIPEWLQKKSSIAIDINQSHIHVVGTFKMGASFAATGNILTSQDTFCHKIFPGFSENMIHAGVVTLKENAPLAQVKKDVQTLLGPSVVVMDHADLIQREQSYWKKRTSIGFMFGMGVIIGLVVGMVIVSQVLFTDTRNRISEYATLRAMGYSYGYLRIVVLTSAWLLAFLGFIPGVITARLLYGWASTKTGLPMILCASTVVYVWWLIFGMCALSGWLASRQLASAQPTRLFG